MFGLFQTFLSITMTITTTSTKPGKWSVMYLCVRGIILPTLDYIFSLNATDLHYIFVHTHIHISSWLWIEIKALSWSWFDRLTWDFVSYHISYVHILSCTIICKFTKSLTVNMVKLIQMITFCDGLCNTE